MAGSVIGSVHANKGATCVPQDVFAAVRGTRLAWIAKRLALMSTAGIAISAYLAWLF
ncbi:hypothetical protein [Streptomyces decoyicus]|uniref:hypothetical protein n=1 Tax=Streptomyces decoyicus TaxID=249567 RepID=UPI0033AB3E90